MPPTKVTPPEPPFPSTLEDFQLWVRESVPMSESQRAQLIGAVGALLNRQRQLWEESKHEAIQALSEGFRAKVSRLHSELTAKEATVSNVSRYFEELVAELTEKSHRDPKTKLMNFDWFMERLETFLAVEQRVRWCAVGVVDITAFKWFNDNLGHSVGDLIIERVAQILSVQIRSDDLLAKERRGARDLHARFGGDEFCFLIPDLPGFEEGYSIAGRFKEAVESYHWARENERLATRPVRVDVGVVCLKLGPIEARRGSAKGLSSELIQWADRLMYEAKDAGSNHPHPVLAGVREGTLAELPREAVAVPRTLPGF